MSENIVKYGLSNVHIAKITRDTDENITYGTPFAVPGAKSLTPDPSGDIKKFYADNIVYYITVSNNGYSGKLEVAMLPDQFFTDILGQATDANGAIIESSDDTNSSFALMGEIEGDARKRRFVYYNVTAKRPSAEAKTNEDSIDPQTDSIDVEMSPRSSDDKVIKAVLELSDTNADVYDAFFDSVYEKDEGETV